MGLARSIKKSAVSTGRATKKMARSIGAGISRAGQATFKSASAAGRAVGGVAISTGRLLWRGAKVAGRSYSRGMLLTYNELQGNKSFVLQEDPSKSESINRVEYVLHHTFSLAWIWGLLGAVVAHSGRSVKNTVVQATSTANEILNARFSNSKLTDKKRAWFPDAMLGFPGFLIGAAFSVIPVSFLLSINTIFHSFVSLRLMFIDVVSLGFCDTDDDFETSRLLENDSHPLQKYILGFPGIIAGAALGFVFANAILSVRIVLNSIKSFLLITGELIKSAFYAKYRLNLTTAPGNQTNFTKYILGFPGIVLGAIVGSVFSVGIYITRGIAHNLQTFALVLTRITNAALAKKYQTAIPKNNQSFVQTYLLGFPGFIVGTVVGSFAFVGIVAGRMLTNSLKTFMEFGGGIMNLGLGLKPFHGVEVAKRRAVERYGFGFLGFALVVPVIALSSAIFAVRHVHVAMAVIVSPAVALVRVLHELAKSITGNLRFSHANSDDRNIKKIKNLYAHLDAFGDFQEADIANFPSSGATYTTGVLKNLGKFIRKSFTFNRDSDTEAFLKLVVEKYEESVKENAQAVDLHIVLMNAFNEADAEIDKDCMLSAREKRQEHVQLQRVSDVVHDYLTADAKQVPSNLYTPENTHNLFFAVTASDPRHAQAVQGVVVEGASY